jgi:hypothetical protein
MSQLPFCPFADSTSSFQLDELTFENQGERMSIYGSVQITLDQQGLKLAKALQQILNATVDYLEQQDLPERITPPDDAEELDNPFWQG